MSESAPLLDPPAGAMRVITRLRDSGYESYFCGGCVRDALMGKPPKDWDITTAATPDDVEKLFAKTVPVGKSFGVMIVVENDDNYEVATFRADLEYVDGRRPEGVRFSGAEEDVQRRDFTINALLYDPWKNEIEDFVGGRADLKSGLLRTVGEARKRFAEDHLRLLRAVRFAARTGFEIEAETFSAIREFAPLVTKVSGERIGGEILLMLVGKSPRRAIELMEATGLLPRVLPEVALMRGVPQPPAFHPEGGVLEHTLLMLDLFEAMRTGRGETESGILAAEEGRRLGLADWDESALEVIAWAALLHDIGKPATITQTESDRIRFNEHDSLGRRLAGEVLERLKRPRKIIDAVQEIIGRHIHFANLPRMRKSKSRRWLREEEFPQHLALHYLDCASSHQMLGTYEYGLAAWREEQALPPELPPLLTGRDLMAMGFTPGPKMGEILREVEDARLEGTLDTPDDAMAFVREKF